MLEPGPVVIEASPGGWNTVEPATFSNLESQQPPTPVHRQFLRLGLLSPLILSFLGVSVIHPSALQQRANFDSNPPRVPHRRCIIAYIHTTSTSASTPSSQQPKKIISPGIALRICLSSTVRSICDAIQLRDRGARLPCSFCNFHQSKHDSKTERKAAVTPAGAPSQNLPAQPTTSIRSLRSVRHDIPP